MTKQAIMPKMQTGKINNSIPNSKNASKPHCSNAKSGLTPQQNQGGCGSKNCFERLDKETQGCGNNKSQKGDAKEMLKEMLQLLLQMLEKLSGNKPQKKCSKANPSQQENQAGNQFNFASASAAASASASTSDSSSGSTAAAAAAAASSSSSITEEPVSKMFAIA